jgi:hypothetical protein
MKTGAICGFLMISVYSVTGGDRRVYRVETACCPGTSVHRRFMVRIVYVYRCGVPVTDEGRRGNGMMRRLKL